jgi:hypothetical protein
MALAYALHHIESNKLAKITNYGEYLAKHPPAHEVEIVENSSWSCVHGIERWRSNCGCNSGTKAGWNQEWRAPLRSALDWLHDDLAGPYEQHAGEMLIDPWAARDDYINVVLDRNPENRDAFLTRHLKRAITPDEQVTIWKLLEMQRHLMLMYTSCGWFFDELSGIEAVQVIEYAGRAIQLAQDLFGDHREERFLELLSRAKSNVPEQGDGAKIYKTCVKPTQVNLLSVGAHYAISSLFGRYAEHSSIFCYNVDLEDHKQLESGRARLALGRAEIRSEITQESLPVSFGVLHFGDHNLAAGVTQFRSEEAYDSLATNAVDAFNRGDLAESLRLLDKHFEGTTYSLKSLFRDEQRRIVRQILKSTIAEAEASYRQIYEHHAPLMRFLTDLNTPQPRVLRLTAEFVLNRTLQRAFEEEDLNYDRIANLLDTAKQEKIGLDVPGLSYALKKRLNQMADDFAGDPEDLDRLRGFESAIEMVRKLPFEVDLWKVQNVYYDLLQKLYPKVRARGDEASGEWSEHFERLGSQLSFNMAALAVEMPVAA